MEIMGDLQLDFSGNKSFCIFVWEQCNSGTDCTAYGLRPTATTTTAVMDAVSWGEYVS